jgi:SAM-dependent methyltransferase
MSVLEIGGAPAKQLTYIAKVLGAKVSAVDFSSPGIQMAKELFTAMHLEGDFRCEDIFLTTFPPESFDFVCSIGVIEHFDSPTGIVRRHVELCKPGGTVLLMIPNYRELYGQLQEYFYPENLSIHNLEMMTCEHLVELAPSDLPIESRAYRWGRLDPALISFHKRWPAFLSFFAYCSLNLIGLLQPFDITILCPLLVLEIKRADRA